MNAGAVATLTQRELLDALRNKWFLVYSGAFVVLCFGLALLIVNSAGYSGISGFGRTAAGLINLVLFLAPLMGLTLGAQALSSEREQGTLAYLLAQPLSFSEIFISKFVGLAAAVGGAVIIGFSFSSLAIAYWSGGDGVEVFIKLLPLTLLLAWTTLALGLVISAQSDRTVTALGVAVVVWLFLVLISNLGLMGTSVVVGMSATSLLAITLINPLEAFRVAAIYEIRGSLEMLGPSGLVARDNLGDSVTLVLVLVMVAWLVAALAVAYFVAKRKELR